jgi:hypothetical protein
MAASRLFRIDEISGAIFPLDKFDREQNDSFIFDVEARDSAPSSLPGTKRGAPNRDLVKVQIFVAGKCQSNSLGPLGCPFLGVSGVSMGYGQEKIQNQTFQRIVGTLVLYTTIYLIYIYIMAFSDANDNAPRFPHPFYTVQVPENVELGKELMTVRAEDPDSRECPSPSLIFHAIQRPNANNSTLCRLHPALLALFAPGRANSLRSSDGQRPNLRERRAGL